MIKKVSPRPLILVHLEDDPLAVKLVSCTITMIADLKVKVQKFITLASFHESCNSLSPDLILMDLELPDSNGLDTLRAVRLHFPRKPIIIITSKDVVEWRLGAKAHGVSDYLLKHELNVRQFQQAITLAIHQPAAPSSVQPLYDSIHALHWPVMVTNTKHQVLYWNRAATQLTGLDAKAAVGTRISEVLLRKDCQKKYLEMQRSVEDGKICQDTLFIQTAQAGYQPVPVISAPLFDSAERVIGRVDTAMTACEAVQRVARTVQDEDRYRALARRFHREAQTKHEQYEAHQQMVGSLVHDLRSPLGALDLLMSIPGDPPDFSRFDPISWELTRSQLQLAIELCNQMLDVRRIEEGRFQLQPREGCLQQTLQTAKQVLSLYAAEKDIDIQMDVPPHVCNLDHALLQRIATNLIENSLKYSESGSAIHISAHLADGKLQLEIADHGYGIPPGELAHIFELYRTGAEDKGGKGVGLAFCKFAAEALGGEIHVESQVGHGTRFTIRIPISHEEHQAQAGYAAFAG